jgi:SSS family solute:Na+ symporter
MTQNRFENTKPAEFQIFSSKEDLAWKHVHRELTEEMNAFNATVSAAATEAGKKTESQALVAYKYDTALGELLDLLPKNQGLLGFVLAALLGAVISSLAAMLNACSSILTLDLVEKHLLPKAPQGTIVFIGRISVVVFAVISCVLAPLMGNPNISNSIFTIIQGGQGLISPGILAVFVFGFLVRRAPRMCGVVGLLVNVVCYGTLWYLSANTDVFAGIDFMNNFLNWMAISFALCLLVQAIMTMVAPLPAPIEFKVNSDLDLKSSRGALMAGIGCIALTVIMYIVFSPIGIAR